MRVPIQPKRTTGKWWDLTGSWREANAILINMLPDIREKEKICIKIMFSSSIEKMDTHQNCNQWQSRSRETTLKQKKQKHDGARLDS